MSQTVSFIANVNLIAEHLAGLRELRDSLDELKKISTNISGLEKIGMNIDKLVGLDNNLPAVMALGNSLDKLIELYENLADIQTVTQKYDSIKSNYTEIKKIESTLKDGLANFTTNNKDIQDIHQDVVLKNQTIEQYLLSIQNKDIEVSNIAAIALAAQKAIDEKYDVYAQMMQYKNELLVIASKIEQFTPVEHNLDEKYQNYLQVLSFKNQIIDMAPRVDELISAGESIGSNMEVAISLLREAREDIELLKNYKTYEEKNNLRFNAIELKEMSNFAKTLSRIKILEDLI